MEAQYSPLYRELGDGTTIWSPLASGVLTGRYNDGIRAGTRRALPGYAWQRSMVLTPERIERVKRLAGIAADLRCTLPQMALAWCLKNPNVSTVITGASRPEQVRENLKAQEVAPLLTDEVMARIEGGGRSGTSRDRPDTDPATWRRASGQPLQPLAETLLHGLRRSLLRASGECSRDRCLTRHGQALC